MESPYTAILLDLYRKKVGVGDPDGFELVAEARNRSCGDKVRLGIRISDVMSKSESDTIDFAHRSQSVNEVEAASSGDERPVSGGDSGRDNQNVSGDRRILEVVHDSEGCVICKASSSIVAITVPGLTIQQAKSLIKIVLEVSESDVNSISELTGSNAPEIGEERLKVLDALKEVQRYPTRKRCFMLAWEALDAAMAANR